MSLKPLQAPRRDEPWVRSTLLPILIIVACSTSVALGLLFALAVVLFPFFVN